MLPPPENVCHEMAQKLVSGGLFCFIFFKNFNNNNRDSVLITMMMTIHEYQENKKKKKKIVRVINEDFYARYMLYRFL